MFVVILAKTWFKKADSHKKRDDGHCKPSKGPASNHSQPASHPASKPAGRPANQPASQPHSQLDTQRASHPFSLPANQTARQPASQLARQEASQLVKPPAIKPAASQPAARTPVWQPAGHPKKITCKIASLPRNGGQGKLTGNPQLPQFMHFITYHCQSLT